MTAVTIDEQTLKDAKERGINISQAAEEGIMKRTNKQEIQENQEYAMELAKTSPDDYWIDPKDNKCKMRPEPQFFISKGNAVYPVSKQEYMKRKNYLCKNPSSVKKKKPKEGDVYIGK